MQKTPISITIDDGCPLIHRMYHSLWPKRDVEGRPITAEGNLVVPDVPNSFLTRFCGIIEKHGIKGNYSIIPMPTEQGDIVRGIGGHEMDALKDWLSIVKARLTPYFDFCPEIITHGHALDLETGGFTALDEETWASTKDRSVLTPYIQHALEMLSAVGIDANGVTSPWSFGIHVEDEYQAAIAEAQRCVHGRTFSWYFLHSECEKPGVKPWVALQDDGKTLVHIPGTIEDKLWQTNDCARTDEAYINGIVDSLITADGKGGAFAERLNAGSWPILVTHWQSLFSNGNETGLTVLDRAIERVNRLLGDRVEWMTSMEMARLAAGE